MVKIFTGSGVPEPDRISHLVNCRLCSGEKAPSLRREWFVKLLEIIGALLGGSCRCIVGIE